MMNLQQTYAGVDPILTTLAQGFMLPATNIANFIAPVVDTPTRAGRILRFGKEQFAINDFRRAYGTNIPYVQSRYDSEPYALEQEVVAWELPEEVIENAGEGPAQVDLRKLQWMNGEYLRAMSPQIFNKMAQEEFEKADVALNENAEAAFALLQPRVKLPSEIVPQGRFLFDDDYAYDEKAVKKLLKDRVFHSTEGREADLPEAGQQRNEVKWQTLEKIVEIFQALETFDEATVDKALHDFVEESGLGFGAVMAPLRIAVSGQQSGPDLAPVLAILGKDKVLARIRKTIERFG